MAAVASYLADTSALARLRHPAVAAILAPLIEAGLVATCGVVEFELGWAARTSAEFDQVRADRSLGYEWLATHDQDWHRARDIQAALSSAPATPAPSASPTCSSPPPPNENTSPSCTTTTTTTSSPRSPADPRSGSYPAAPSRRQHLGEWRLTRGRPSSE
jgi:predicted nucleic acid-binding protein